jgi:hypothetical protein
VTKLVTIISVRNVSTVIEMEYAYEILTGKAYVRGRRAIILKIILKGAFTETFRCWVVHSSKDTVGLKFKCFFALNATYP